jgi:hypothetical protein
MKQKVKTIKTMLTAKVKLNDDTTIASYACHTELLTSITFNPEDINNVDLIEETLLQMENKTFTVNTTSMTIAQISDN